MKERLGRGNAHENICELRARRLTTNGYTTGIATEGTDILLYPRERSDQIVEPIVRGSCVLLAQEGFAIQEAKNAESIRDRDTDDTFAGEIGAIIHGLESMAGGEASSMDPDKDGEGTAAFRRADVEVEAIFVVRYS